MALLAWPAGPSEAPQRVPPGEGRPGEFSVASWPARGAEADSPTVLRAVAAAWRSAADDAGVLAPGEVVEPLYVGDPDGFRVALARSAAADGRLLVAAAVQRSGGWRVLDVAEASAQVSWLVLPSGDPPRVLVSPEVAAAGSLLVRRDDGVWTRVATRDDGTTATLRSLDGPEPILAVVASVGAGRGLVDIAALSRTSVLPTDPPVRAESPRWSRTAALTPEEYDAALFAAPALPDGTGQLAVLASTRVPGGRAVLVETQSAADGQFRNVLVVPGADDEAVVGDPPVVGDRLAGAVASRGGGRALVLAASAPSIARIEVRLPDGTSVIDGIGPTAVVLAPPLPAQVTVLGKRSNGSVVSSIVLPLAGAIAPSPG